MDRNLFILLWGEYSRLREFFSYHVNLATTSRLLRDTSVMSRLIRDVMDRPLLAQRTDCAQPSPASINKTMVNPEKAKGLGGVGTHVRYF